MADREEIIKGLECCYDPDSLCANSGCPYYGRDDEDRYCDVVLVQDALALLKAQEPVNPVVDIDTWKCGNCGHVLEHQQLLGDNVLFHEQYNYCPECGRAVKWE